MSDPSSTRKADSGSLAGQALRFLVVGGTNTILTYVLLVGLALVIPFPVAYAIAFAVGLAWTLYATRRFVFRSDAQWWVLVVYLGWYLLVFGVGQLVIHLLNPHGFWPVAGTSLVILAVTTPLTFLGGRVIFARGGASKPPRKPESRMPNELSTGREE
ncbi:hypothetical protein LSHI6S_02556 [Leifsonia shinshuensis]